MMFTGVLKFESILFYLFSFIILISALKVVTSKNPVHAALWLVLTFWSSACLWVLMQAEFLGVILVLVYVGAVMVLFLFVVMMLNIDIEEMRAGFWKNLPISFTVGILMSLSLILILINPNTNLAAFGSLSDLPADYNSVREIGKILYTDYLIAFELAAVLLVLGMVAAIALVHRKSNNKKYIQPKDQVKVRHQDRVRVVKMDSVVEEINIDSEEDFKEGENK